MTTARRSLLPVLPLLLLLLSLAEGTPAEEPPPLAGRTVRLEAWGLPVRDVLALVARETGVTVRVSPAFLPPSDLETLRLYYDTGEVPLPLALEWICRDLGCRFRVDGPESVWLSGGYDWLSKNPAEHQPVSYRHRVGTLLGPHEEPQAFRRNLLEVVRIQALLDNAFVSLEEPYLAVVAMLPPKLRDTLHASLLAMTEPGIPLDRPLPATMEPGLARLVQALRERRVVLHLRDQPLRLVLHDIATQTGIPLVLDASVARANAERRLTLDAGEVTARAALDLLRERLGIAGVELYADGGVRLSTTTAGWPRRAPVSRAFLWEEAAVRAYDVRPLESAYPSGDELALYVRRRVLPEAWRDPVTGILFHPPSGNLIIVASPRVQEEVHAELSRTALALRRGASRGGTAP